MTVKELAAALASLPEEVQNRPVVYWEEGDPIEVRTLLTSVHEVGEHVAHLVRVDGWIPPGLCQVLYRQPDGWRVAAEVNAPKCPKCGATMTGGGPHGPWPVQWECRACGWIHVPLSGGE